MIELDSGKEQIKLNRTILHSTGISSAIAGLFLWSITPFVTESKLLRFGSLGTSLILGGISLASGVKLEQNKTLYRAIQKAEEDDFLHRIASAQYGQQQVWETIAAGGTRRDDLPVGATSTLEVPGSDAEVSEVPEDGELTDSLPGSNQTSQLVAGSPGSPGSVKKAIKEGKSDTWIIENILKMGGRKFEEGKVILEEMKKWK